ncbi:phosphatase PAP2 family protein [Streptomyces sp. SP17BM10]|uniref:phosphatase PAP2 family protein n=1 Tax=Streptomyces sp. SP17BM10 TaxID=3002530 RepID=UPI002E775B48|nr:phosphatase PAP2 family protein [Streptomyces sp. SP17BM10]MEE1781479.1 phosphatase PAP2 family protein [Streptomyces sp. SP17BM10]
MQNLTLTWQSAGGIAVVLYGGAYIAARVRKPSLSALLREAGTLLALFALWQLVGHLSVMSADHALDRADWIHRTELAVGLPDEASWQAAITPYPVLVRLANYYYAVMHFGVMLVVLLWVFLRHRERYAWVRNTVVITTAVCLLVQFIPVAPPRMLPGNGFVDVAAEYGQSVYGGAVGGMVVADQLSAMPSVHVAWCVLAAVAVIHVARSPLRWLMLLHPVLTVAVVVVTANHFWADGIVAVTILLFAYAVLALGARRRGRSSVSTENRPRSGSGSRTGQVT